MTQKELLYLEDAIGHEKSIIDICSQTLNYLEDDNLKSFMRQEIEQHKKEQANLFNLLEVKVNE